MRRTIALACALTLLGLACAGCNRHSALPLQPEPFRGDEAGYSIRYPVGWSTMFLEQYNGTLFFHSGENIENIITWRLAGEAPIVLILAGPTGSTPNVAHDTIVDAETMLIAYLDWMRYADNAKIGRFQEITVDGHPGLMADIRWSRDEVKIAGRAVAVYGEDRSFFLEAAGRAKDWRSYLSTLTAVLDSVRLD